MKGKMLNLALLCFCIWTYPLIAQERTFEDIALDYLKERLNKHNRGLRTTDTKYHKLPNGNMIVMMHVKWSDGYIEDVYDSSSLPGVHGNYLTQQGWVHSDVVVKRTELKGEKKYAVFVSRTGTPLTYFQLPEEFDIVPIKQGYVCFLFDKSFQNVGSKSTPFYNNVICRDYEGNRLWGFPNDLIAFDIANTDNNVYIAGEILKDDGAYSLIRVVEIKTGKSNDYVGKKGDISLGVNIVKEGIWVTEFQEEGFVRSYVLPYPDNEKDFQINVIMKEYNLSNAYDQVSIGERYLTGNVFPKDEKKAFEWFQKAANQNNGDGLFKLGCCYQNGYGVTPNKEKAIYYYEKSANLGNSNAISTVIKMYLIGDSITRNMSRAMYWQEVLAFKGYTEAQSFVLLNQSVEHEKANVNPLDLRYIAIKSHQEKSYEWAEFCIKRAIELGDTEAPLYYGLWLGKGDGVQKDYAKAELYLTDYAERGNTEAASLLGKIQKSLNNKEKELYWIEKAALRGDGDSQQMLAEAYMNGDGIKKDKKTAIELMEKAALNGNKEAMKRMVYNHALGHGVKKDINKALAWSIELDSETQLSIADSFFSGNGVKKNKSFAISIWEHLAAIDSNFDAIRHLSLCYINGDGVSQDFGEAERLIENLVKNSTTPNILLHSESSYLMGILREAQGKTHQAMDCYKNSSKPEAKERYASLLKETR